MSTFIQITGYLAVVAGVLMLLAMLGDAPISPALGIGTALSGAFLCVFGQVADDLRVIKKILLEREERRFP
jgi:hypothetical protein